ncbi:MAG TPA: tyrosine-type recombinase/integrase [Armatimonadota bacterium]|jgi:integrase
MGRRRGHNEGSVHYRHDRDRWVAELTVEDGRRRQFYCKTEKEARTKLISVLGDLQRGMLPSGRQQSVKAFLEHWIENVAKQQVRPKTWDRYSGQLKKHIVPALGRKQLGKLSAQDLQVFYNRKISEGLAPRSVVHMHRVLHKALGEAVRLDLISRNPCALVKPPKVSQSPIRFLTAEEAKTLLAAAQDDPLEALYVLALTTGMRQGELLGLRWDCVDLDGLAVHVRRTVYWRQGHGFVWSEPKSKASQRRVSLTEVAASTLRHHRERQSTSRLLAGDAWCEQGLVFPNSVGNPINANNLLNRSFKPLLERAGLPKVRFHDLRHSAASLLLSLGTHPKIVQELLGHSSISVTLDIYSHAIPTLQDQAVSQLADLLGRGQGSA